MHRQQGFTLTELLVTLGVFGILAAIAFSLYASSAKLISSDQGRINTNQNLRTSLDLITQDLRAAGESLPSSFRFSGVDFNAATDSLTVRRGISIPVLSVCDSVSSSSSSIKVTGKPAVPPACRLSAPFLMWVGPPPAVPTGSATRSTPG